MSAVAPEVAAKLAMESGASSMSDIGVGGLKTAFSHMSDSLKDLAPGGMNRMQQLATPTAQQGSQQPQSQPESPQPGTPEKSLDEMNLDMCTKLNNLLRMIFQPFQGGQQDDAEKKKQEETAYVDLKKSRDAFTQHLQKDSNPKPEFTDCLDVVSKVLEGDKPTIEKAAKTNGPRQDLAQELGLSAGPQAGAAAKDAATTAGIAALSPGFKLGNENFGSAIKEAVGPVFGNMVGAAVNKTTEIGGADAGAKLGVNADKAAVSNAMEQFSATDRGFSGGQQTPGFAVSRTAALKLSMLGSASDALESSRTAGIIHDAEELAQRQKAAGAPTARQAEGASMSPRPSPSP
jgi:hypothetical protein